MKTRWMATAALALALGACGKNGDGGNAAAGKGPTAAAPSSAPSGAARLRPGLYETAMEMTISGLPPEVAKAMAAHKTTGRSCVTAEDANRPNGDLFGGKQAEGCTQKDVVYGGGRIHGTMSCAPKRNGEPASSFTMDGSYSGDGFDVRMKIVTAAEGRNMVMEGHTIGRRVGDCPAGEKES
ncbi:MAG: DUF3617 domain-containing protein [Allosphingosinicella sp.]